MKIRLSEGLPYVAVTLVYRNQILTLDNILLDTGSAGTIFSVDTCMTIGLHYAADDPVHRIGGVGGAEFVFTKQVEQISIGELAVNNFIIEIGAMDYGIEIDGIVGMDFLTQVKATIDLSRFEIY
ncbi:MAG: retropepsin-like domain-containing protein [Chloroflexota bacterium]|nr:retropepsin-like domain-containing protein [Chloroflexota bacterium]